MTRRTLVPIVLALGLALQSCADTVPPSDAYGHFEAREMTVSAEVAGPLVALAAEEGAVVDSGVVVGHIDTTSANIRRVQLLAQMDAARSKMPTVQSQAAVYAEQRETAVRERERFGRLLAQGAATAKQVDDLDAQVRLIDRQIAVLRTQLGGIDAEVRSLQSQMASVDDQIRRSRVVNPFRGTVLRRYAERGELASPGKPLYSIASLDTLDLKVYVTGEQLAQAVLGAEATVIYDGPAGELARTAGWVARVSDQAEFTPKVLQTRDERTALVYAVVLRVPNPKGRLKIGMPGEVVFAAPVSGAQQ